jgi:alanine racemase
MLYGASPFNDVSAAELGLEPVMTLRSAVIAVQQIKAGAHVGYGGTFTADADMRIGVVACGYADGYPRHAATGTPILVDGIRTRTLGRVSMDMLMIDLTTIPHVEIGAPVTLWGEGLSVEEVARAACTISYELLCARAERVPLIVLN